MKDYSAKKYGIMIFLGGILLFSTQIFASSGNVSTNSGSKMTGDIITTGDIKMTGDIITTGNNLTGSSLPKEPLTGKILTGTVGGSGSKLSGTVATGSVSTGSILTGTILTGSVSTGSAMTGSTLTGAVLTGTITTGTITTGTITTGTITTGTITTGTIATGTVATGTVATGSSNITVTLYEDDKSNTTTAKVSKNDKEIGKIIDNTLYENDASDKTKISQFILSDKWTKKRGGQGIPMQKSAELSAIIQRSGLSEEEMEATNRKSSIGETGNNDPLISNNKARAKFLRDTMLISTKGTITKPQELKMLQRSKDALPTEIQRIPAEKIAGNATLGPDDDNLIFSQPVELTIPVESKPGETQGKEVDISVYHAGDEKVGTRGISTNPNTECTPEGEATIKGNRTTVSNNEVTFYTCSASTFIVSYPGGATLANFVDNESKNKTITVDTNDTNPGSHIEEVVVVVDFHSIDGVQPSSPGAGSSHANENSFSITSPTGTTVDLLSTGTYTDTSNAQRVTVTFDDQASSLPSGLPATETFLPTGNLSDFVGEDPHGDWTFTFADSTLDDGLTLHNVDIIITDDIICSSDNAIIGGEVTSVSNTPQTVQFSTITSHNYISPPLVLAVPKTTNNGDNYPNPIIENVTANSFDISLCVDSGGTNCDASPSAEDFSIFLIDQDITACAPDIDAGTVSASTDGSLTSFNFNKSFSNKPYIFTTPQGYSQNGNIAATSWADQNNVTTSQGAIIGCVHQGIGDSCTTGQPNETFGWVAIDPIRFSMSGLWIGSESITDSTWENISYYGYTNNPEVMVTQNSDNDSQDPKYPRTQNVGLNSADIRYCEQDGANTCDTHTAEDVAWFSVPNGDDSIQSCDTQNLIAGGTITNLTETAQTIQYSNFTSHTYSTPPIILVNPSTQNNGENYPVPTVSNVTTTSFDIHSCLDNTGGHNCARRPLAEDFSFFIIDQDIVACTPHTDAGTTTIPTDGTTTNISFSTSLGSNPYVFSSIQTNNQKGNRISAVSRATNTFSTGATLKGCTHQGIADICTVGEPSETVGWFAFNPQLVDIDGIQFGKESIADSTWTSVTFSPTYSSAPTVIVSQNSDNDPEDPKYQWAKNTTTSGVDIRYCEADDANVCDVHSNETTVWLSLGNINSTTGDLIIDLPTSNVFSGVKTDELQQVLTGQFPDYFTVNDTKGEDAGWYTTLSITNLTGTNTPISNSNLERKGNGVTVLSGDNNPEVKIDPDMQTYITADTTAILLKRDPGPNGSKVGTYGTLVDIRLTVPPYTESGIYSAQLQFTLYEN